MNMDIKNLEQVIAQDERKHGEGEKSETTQGRRKWGKDESSG
jgi:hypothetical protein